MSPKDQLPLSDDYADIQDEEDEEDNGISFLPPGNDYDELGAMNANDDENDQMQEVRLGVPCEECLDVVESSLRAQAGVRYVYMDTLNQEVTVAYSPDEVDLARLREIIAAEANYMGSYDTADKDIGGTIR